MNKSDIGKMVFLKRHNIEGVLEDILHAKEGSYAGNKGYDYVIVLKEIGIDAKDLFMTFPVNDGDLEFQYIH
jgi:hypothetical protein